MKRILIALLFIFLAFAAPPKPATNSTANITRVPFQFPANGIAVGKVAILGSKQTIVNYWKNDWQTSIAAWDNSTQRYSMTLLSNGEFVFRISFVNGTSSQYQGGSIGCVRGKQNGTLGRVFGWSASELTYQGTSIDPFLGTMNMFDVYALDDLETWMWVNRQTNDLTYAQYFNRQVNLRFVIYYPQGVFSSMATSYEFTVLGCNSSRSLQITLPDAIMRGRSFSKTNIRL